MPDMTPFRLFSRLFRAEIAPAQLTFGGVSVVACIIALLSGLPSSALIGRGNASRVRQRPGLFV